jgi:hypothetical protein
MTLPTNGGLPRTDAPHPPVDPNGHLLPPTPAVDRPKFLPLTMRNVKLDALFARQVVVVNPPEGTPFEELLRPDYWSNVAFTITPGAHIEVVPDDSTYWAELLVRDVSPLSVRVAVLRHVKFDELEPLGQASDYATKFIPSLRWTVTRLSDNHRVAENLQTREDAEREILNLLQTRRPF